MPTMHGKTLQRKLPLVIHVDPAQVIALNKTCRYCSRCDLLIAHQDEIEAFLTAFFSQNRPGVVGNPYLVVGTESRAAWLSGMRTPQIPTEALEQVHDFIEVVEFQITGGWVRAPGASDR
ncbi:MAG: hypothetical protein ACKVVP_18800 [Chloroflexota bacterium]